MDVIDEQQGLIGDLAFPFRMEGEGAFDVAKAHGSTKLGLAWGTPVAAQQVGLVGKAAGACEALGEEGGLVEGAPGEPCPMEGDGHDDRGFFEEIISGPVHPLAHEGDEFVAGAVF